MHALLGDIYVFKTEKIQISSAAETVVHNSRCCILHKSDVFVAPSIERKNKPIGGATTKDSTQKLCKL